MSRPYDPIEGRKSDYPMLDKSGAGVSPGVAGESVPPASPASTLSDVSQDLEAGPCDNVGVTVNVGVTLNVRVTDLSRPSSSQQARLFRARCAPT